MKKLFLISAIMFLFLRMAFSQEPPRTNSDSLWYFHPFSIDLSAGMWIPAGKLSDYYGSSVQFGAGFGLMISEKTRFQLWMMPRLLNQKKSIPIKVDDSIVYYDKNTVGASLGGWLSYTFYQDKLLSSEIMTGISWEDIPTDIQKPNCKDLFSVSGLGLSIGVNSWINTFSNLNFGLRAIYTYSTYNKSKFLVSSIGGNSFTFSLVYRYPKRNQDFKR